MCSSSAILVAGNNGRFENNWRLSYNIKKWSHYRHRVAQRVSRGIALLFHDRGTRRGWVVRSTPRPHFTPGKDPVSIVQEVGWAPGPVWTGGTTRPHRDSFPNPPARSQSLYRLSYPTHHVIDNVSKSQSHTAVTFVRPDRCCRLEVWREQHTDSNWRRALLIYVVFVVCLTMLRVSHNVRSNDCWLVDKDVERIWKE